MIMAHLQPTIGTLELLTPPSWQDYELLDSGDGQKFERFGEFYLVRPESQAIWAPALAASEWERADARFQRSKSEDSPGQWQLRRSLPESWPMHYHNLSFWARLTPFKHTGVFPEHSAQWEWIRQQLTRTGPQPNVLVLFGYTGLSSLWAAQVGARVSHVDASRPAVRWAQENQQASGLLQAPIRWFVDDVGKFVAREIRRGNRYDLILLDPPVFGRGPKGEIWRLSEQLPNLIAHCAALLSDSARGLLLSAYATNVSALTLANVLADSLHGRSGAISAGELVLRPLGSGRTLPAALYARWSAY
jgi:23S rRNA (cytosine1962-C5)-methyltransferase